VIRLGTSGFSYRDWVGPFYPHGMKARDMFEYYQQHFDTVELDYTYYAMPTAKGLGSLGNRTTEGFSFSVRTHKAMTHDQNAAKQEIISASLAFAASLSPLVEMGKLGSVLLQYPWSYRMNAGNISKMLFTAECFSGLRLTVEFRNDSWANEHTLSVLKSYGLGFCCVDEPRLPGLFPPILANTADFGYLRFHGRNAKNWWNSKPGLDRYDYDYPDDELDEWIPGIHKIALMVKDTYIYMNNCHMGKAAKNARRLKDKLV
jgi:uncharacterized protein YecE (DUF72 family)